MGLFHFLLETYDRCLDSVGVVHKDTDGRIDDKKTLLPIFHMTFKSEICILIDQIGSFINVNRDDAATTIIIPCTERSAGRSSGIAPHPLCDQLDYVGGFNSKKTKSFLTELGAWKTSNVLLNAVYTYVSSGEIMDDLLRANIFKESEYQTEPEGNEEKQIDLGKIRKIGVRFSVQIPEDTVNTWESNDLRALWIDNMQKNFSYHYDLFDYLSGEPVGKIAAQHPKNIYSYAGNAKLFSCNDKTEFTFRGRFNEQDDAVIIDYSQSQKMHQMLRWLIANYGYSADTQVIITWAVDNNVEVKEKAQLSSFDLFAEMEEIKTDSERMEQTSALLYTDYAVKLKSILLGYGDVNYLKEHARKICIAAFDAATTGRLGLVFYQELFENEYLESIINWHNDSSFYHTAWQNKKIDDREKKVMIEYIGAPSYDDILFAVHGRAQSDASYNLLKKSVRKQMLECMFGNSMLPKNIVEAATNRSSSPMSFTDSNGLFSYRDWERSVNITCSLIRKFYTQNREEINLVLDEKRTTRDYLFGRLLSVAERLEGYALYKSDIKRPTNAVKLMSAFQIKPYSTWGQLYSLLIPYKNQLDGAGYYQSLIDEIMEKFEEGDFENNTPLTPLYLLGYSLQNRKMLKKGAKTKKINNLGDYDNDSTNE